MSTANHRCSFFYISALHLGLSIKIKFKVLYRFYYDLFNIIIDRNPSLLNLLTYEFFMPSNGGQDKAMATSTLPLSTLLTSEYKSSTSSDLEQHHLYNDNQRAIEFVSQLSSLVIQSCARSNVLRKNQIHKHCINSALIVFRTTFRLDLFIKASFTSTVESAFERGNSLCSLV